MGQPAPAVVRGPQGVARIAATPDRFRWDGLAGNGVVGGAFYDPAALAASRHPHRRAAALFNRHVGACSRRCTHPATSRSKRLRVRRVSCPVSRTSERKGPAHFTGGLSACGASAGIAQFGTAEDASSVHATGPRLNCSATVAITGSRAAAHTWDDAGAVPDNSSAAVPVSSRRGCGSADQAGSRVRRHDKRRRPFRRPGSSPNRGVAAATRHRTDT